MIVWALRWWTCGPRGVYYDPNDPPTKPRDEHARGPPPTATPPLPPARGRDGNRHHGGPRAPRTPGRLGAALAGDPRGRGEVRHADSPRSRRTLLLRDRPARDDDASSISFAPVGAASARSHPRAAQDGKDASPSEDGPGDTEETTPRPRSSCSVESVRKKSPTSSAASTPISTPSCSDAPLEEHIRVTEEVFPGQETRPRKEGCRHLPRLAHAPGPPSPYGPAHPARPSRGLDSTVWRARGASSAVRESVVEGGSLTLIATASSKPARGWTRGSFRVQRHRNSEIVLSRKLAENRVFPAIDLAATSTRREEPLSPRRTPAHPGHPPRPLGRTDPIEAMRLLLDKMK